MLRRISYNYPSTSEYVNENQRNEKLQDYVNKMRISSICSAKAELCIQKIVNVLMDNSGKYGIDIDRVKVVGSFMKKTYTEGSDIDLTVFINNAYPPFNNILRKFDAILASNLGVLVSRKKILISFQMSTFKFDVVPATNFEDGVNPNSQLIGALKYITKNVANPVQESYLHGSGWSEYATNFISENSKFILDVIMIARQWIKGITFSYRHVPALSFSIEIIAVFANRGKYEGSLQTGFVRFLELMEKFDTIDIQFNDYEWLQQDIGLNKPLHSLPRIIDPINVWHNLADKIYATNQVKIMRAAKFTLERLRNSADLLELLASRSYNFV